MLGAKTIARNFDSFLQLLTTQLQNQSPLDLLDTEQSTQQLVQFAQVEQQLNKNRLLFTLISAEQRPYVGGSRPLGLPRVAQPSQRPSPSHYPAQTVS